MELLAKLRRRGELSALNGEFARVRIAISVRFFRDESLAESDANMPLLTCLSRTWAHIQDTLFPWLTEELGPLTDMHKQVVTALEVAGVEAFVQGWPGLPGR